MRESALLPLRPPPLHWPAIPGITAFTWRVRGRSGSGRGSRALTRRWATAPIGGTSSPSAAWATLGLPPGSPKKEVKARYRRLAAIEHPDLKPDDPEAAQRFARINAAYEELMSASSTSSWPKVATAAQAAAAQAAYADTEAKKQRASELAELFGKLGMSVEDAKAFLISLSTFGFFAFIATLVFAMFFLAVDSPERVLSAIFKPAPGSQDSVEGLQESLEAGKEWLKARGMEPDPEMMEIPAKPDLFTMPW